MATLDERPLTMREMVIYGVSFDMVGKQPIVLLKTADGNRFLPIWIGHPEAAAILVKLQNAAPARPMTHDLAERRARAARRRGGLDRRHRDAREHLLRADHAAAERLGDRDRLASLRRDRAGRPGRREDLRRRRGDRRVRGGVRGRRVATTRSPRRGRAAARRARPRRVPRVPRLGLAGRVRRRPGQS